jgi:fumarylacetoacetate (FAA) hydrolase family protein
VPIEEDQVRPHAIVGMLVDPNEAANRGAGAALGNGVELSDLEGRHGFLWCTGWCVLLLASLPGS